MTDTEKFYRVCECGMIVWGPASHPCDKCGSLKGDHMALAWAKKITRIAELEAAAADLSAFVDREGDYVTIRRGGACFDVPKFVATVTGKWNGWRASSFYGDSVAEALAKAAKSMRAYKSAAEAAQVEAMEGALAADPTAAAEPSPTANCQLPTATNDEGVRP